MHRLHRRYNFVCCCFKPKGKSAIPRLSFGKRGEDSWSWSENSSSHGLSCSLKHFESQKASLELRKSVKNVLLAFLLPCTDLIVYVLMHVIWPNTSSCRFEHTAEATWQWNPSAKLTKDSSWAQSQSGEVKMSSVYMLQYMWPGMFTFKIWYCCHLQGKRSTAGSSLCPRLQEESTLLKIDAAEIEQTASPLSWVMFAWVSPHKYHPRGCWWQVSKTPAKPAGLPENKWRAASKNEALVQPVNEARRRFHVSLKMKWRF